MKNKFATTTLMALCLSMTLSVSQAKALPANLEPEVESSVWEENDQECASVTLNGKELIAFRAVGNSESLEDQAENLADKLQELLKDDKVDASRLVPAQEGNLAAIHLDGNTVLTFTPPAGQDIQPIEHSFKLVNAMRNVLGIQAIPQSFLKMAESQGADQAYVALSRSTVVAPVNFSADFSGQASWYGGKFHGRRTSNGDVFDQDGFTAAHRTLPFGTKLLVMNRRTGDSCVVEVNDRGPFCGERVIDLSRGAANKLNMLSSGVATVDCMVLPVEKIASK
ncbi:MAG TPA: septal ring lytic transglycosylase RlpA family protein [Candidatus Obscuribacter sp.]|nr:septal ring lytic transglycosylase RlpA family protein [Candidatus Obscuribacter sp.]